MQKDGTVVVVSHKTCKAVPVAHAGAERHHFYKWKCQPEGIGPSLVFSLLIVTCAGDDS